MLKSYLEKEEDGLVIFLTFIIGWFIPWIVNPKKSQSRECSKILWILWRRS